MASANPKPRPVENVDGAQTLPALFHWRVEKTPRWEAYRQFYANGGRWIGYSWREIDQQLEAWRRALDTEQLSPGERVANESDFLLQRIAKAVKSFPVYATPRAVWWTTEPWTIAAGLLTPTLKIKRAALEQRLAPEIEQLYSRKRPAQAREAHSGRPPPN